MSPNSMIVASISVTAALLIWYVYLYITERKPYLLAWLLSLVLLLATYLSRIGMIGIEREHPVLLIINFAATIVGYWFIFKGTRMFFGKKETAFWNISPALLVISFSLWTALGLSMEIILLTSVVYTVALLVSSGITCLRCASPRSQIRIILGYIYFLWALIILTYPLSRILEMVPVAVSYLLIGVIGLMAFICIQAMYFQSIREELEIKEANIRKLMVYDKLTGAFSRNYFEQISEDFYGLFPLPSVLALGDFNGLKLINDTFGHQKGDELLTDGFRTVQSSIRDKDILIRWGGDELILVMPDITLVEAEELIGKIKEELKSIQPKTIPLDISFGLSIINTRDQDIAEIIKQAEDRMYSNKLRESKRTRMAVIEFLQELLWEKDYQTEEHVMRLSRMVRMIGIELGLSAREIVDLTQVAMLHDIGKISVPVEILNKPGILTAEEWAAIKKHSEIGYRIARSSGELAHISEAILYHHEWWDGSGYPQGLKGEEIPLYSRIVSIVDSYDVMTHHRPYKQTMDHATALEEIRKWSGKQFDPYLVSVFARVVEGKVEDMVVSR